MYPLLQDWEVDELEAFGAQIDRLIGALDTGRGSFVSPPVE
jgi:hypothetical protein